MVVPKETGTEKREKNKEDLARHHGYDISMSDSALGTTTAFYKEYKTKCRRIYKDFLKTMNSHIQEEKDVKKTLRKLNREKINNQKFSLYRSAGNDLFSTAKQIRQKLMESKLLTVSPLMEEFQANTPWGLDAIPDEDLLRPQTAPSHAVDRGQAHVTSRPDTLRPMTVAKGNSYDLPDEHQHNQQHAFFRPKSVDSEREVIRIPTGAKSEKVRFQSPITPEHHVDKDGEGEESESEEVADGEVDPCTERTRARKITIDPMVFAKLAKGNVDITLKNKTGKYIIKPVVINYTVSDVDAVFMPKDPSKEKMALVREKTTPDSGTVAADMKINNKIAIMKSLVGKDAKKTTVAEIMENARYRKTRHFKIVKQLTPEEEKRRESIVKSMASTWKYQSLDRKKAAPETENTNPTNGSMDMRTTAMSYYSLRKQQKLNQENTSNRQEQVGVYQGDVPDPRYVSPKVLAARERRQSITSIHRPQSQCTDNSHEGLNHSHSRATFSRQREGTPLDRAFTPRAPSAMSVRGGDGGHGMPFTGNDKHMTDLIRRLIEGKDEIDHQGQYLDQSLTSNVQSKDKHVTLKVPKRAHTPSVVTSDSRSEVSLSFDVPNKINSAEVTRRIVNDLLKKDMEDEENMNSWKRRMLAGRSTPSLKRRPSVYA